MSPPKPRQYDGPVDWIDAAQAVSAEWPDSTLIPVLARFPYDAHGTGVRRQDWLVLVAHVSRRRGEDPIQCAERLANYVTAYRERYDRTLTPVQVKGTQDV